MVQDFTVVPGFPFRVGVSFLKLNKEGKGQFHG